MPNWCLNSIRFNGVTEEEFDKVVDVLCTKNEDGSVRFDFEKLMPMPDNVFTNGIGRLTTVAVSKFFYENPLGLSEEERMKYINNEDCVYEISTYDENGKRTNTTMETYASWLEWEYYQTSDLEDYVKYNKPILDNWYDWSIKNWGTKWNACYTMINVSKNDEGVIDTRLLEFETAWSPASDEIYKLMIAKCVPIIGIEKANDIEIYYEEPGCDFSGLITIEFISNSDIILHKDNTYSEIERYDDDDEEEEDVVESVPDPEPIATEKHTSKLTKLTKAPVKMNRVRKLISKFKI